MQKVLLQGRPRSGKSSFLRNCLQGLPLRGFAMQRLIRDGETWAFRLLDLAEEPYVTHLETTDHWQDIAIARLAPGKWQGITATFEGKGCRALEKCLGFTGASVLDELGIFEGDAHKFQQALFNLLDSPQPVLGVLKDKSSPFLDGVRTHPRVQVFPFPSLQAVEKVETLVRGLQEAGL